MPIAETRLKRQALEQSWFSSAERRPVRADPSNRPVASTLVIACGALAREINHLKTTHAWDHIQLQCLPAVLHNRPEQIPERLREQLAEAHGRYEQIFVAYADCGTGGGIDAVLAQFDNVRRLPGPHCYATYAGQQQFLQLSENEPGTLYLTDFLARHFRRFVIEPLKLDEHPELRDAFFGNYKRVLFISQSSDDQLQAAARSAAQYLGLEFQQHHCGYGELKTQLVALHAG